MKRQVSGYTAEVQAHPKNGGDVRTVTLQLEDRKMSRVFAALDKMDLHFVNGQHIELKPTYK